MKLYVVVLPPFVVDLEDTDRQRQKQQQNGDELSWFARFEWGTIFCLVNRDDEDSSRPSASRAIDIRASE